MNVHEAVTRLCPTALCGPNQRAAARLHQGFRGLLYDAYTLWRDFASPDRSSDTINLTGGDILGDRNAQRTGRRFIQSLKPADRPRFDFLHVMMPHEPWHYLPTGQDYRQLGAARGLENYEWGSEWAARLGRERHLLMVAATDRLLGQIVDKLKRIGAYDDSLVVVNADHGAAFVPEHPIRGLSRANFPQIVWTPLFVKPPNQTDGGIDDVPARTIDVLPTIADHLDVRTPWKVDGHSLLRRVAPDQPVRVFEWEFSPWKPPPGREFVTIPAERGFADVLRARASDAPGDPALRLYRFGPYADLFGREVESLERPAPTAPTGTLEVTGRVDQARPDAHLVPWAYVQGTIKGVEPNTPLALTVNGVVAGFSGVYDEPGSDELAYWTVLPPALFRRGENDVRVYVIRGGPDDPGLVPVFPDA
jgi:hypothetical protein